MKVQALTLDDNHAAMWGLALSPANCSTHQGLKFLTYEIRDHCYENEE